MFLSSKGNCKLGSKCASKQTDKSGSEVKTRSNSVVVANTLDYTQAEDNITSVKFNAKGDLPHQVSAISVKPCFFLKVWEEDGEEVPTGSRRRTISAREQEERSNFGN